MVMGCRCLCLVEDVEGAIVVELKVGEGKMGRSLI